MSSGIPATEVEAPVPPIPPTGRPISFRFVPALDGIRAVAVLGVMLYHGGAPLVGGGFMGVNMFFVLSGFLITSLLLGEWVKRMTIRLGQFWTRRARRLLPALLVMLVGVAIYAKVFATPGEFASLRLDSLSTLFYVANWHFIFSGSSYFVQTSQPSPLEHMWSLSIEEQFYIVWPPVALLMLRLGRRLRPSRRLWPIFATAVVGALASAADMRFSFFHHASVTRLYEGTDTRCQDIFVGASLAIGLAIWAEHRRPETERSRLRRSSAPKPRFGADLSLITAWEITSPLVRMCLQVIGWAALAGLLFLWTRVTSTQPPSYLFEGGYLLFAVAVAAVIFCIVTAQRGSLSLALGNPVFRYIGKISYGTYLWHVPLFDLLDASRVHLYGLPLLVVRIGATLVVATGSFYLVEQPIRRGRMRSITEWKAWLMTSAAFVGVVVVTVAATLPTSGAAGAAAIPVPSGAQYTGPPVGVTMFGDSLAFTAGWSIATNNAQDPYDVRFHSQGLLGCGIMVVDGQFSGGMEYPTSVPCSSSSPPSKQWPAYWAGLLATQRPNVTMLMAGRWEVSNQVIHGQVMHIGEPSYDAVLRADVDEAVRVGTSTGAYMMLLTAPCFDSGEQPNGQPWPEDSTARRLDYDRILDQVAAAHPRNVEVFNFGGEVCPGGHFESTIDGVRIRLSDGVHFPYQSGVDGSVVPTAKWLAWKLFPEAVRVGRLQMAGIPLR
jgi:peptidoglycan/LPS O-acetylase OafA/YrhL